MWVDANGTEVARGLSPFVFDANGYMWFVDVESGQALSQGATLYFAGADCTGAAYALYVAWPRRPIAIGGESGYRVRPDTLRQQSVCANSFRSGVNGELGICLNLGTCSNVDGVPVASMTHLPSLAPPSLGFVGPLHPEP